MSERILVTGGEGFIGSHLVEYLLKLGNEVVVLDRQGINDIENLSDVKKEIEYFQGDVCNRETISEAFNGVTKVYHLAAELGVDRVLKMPPSQIMDVDMHGTQNVLQECIDSDVKTLLFASTSEVYGHYSLEKLPMAEDDEFEPDTVYGEAKIQSEIICKRFSEEFGLRTVSVRYFNIYGPRQSLSGYAVPHFFNAALRNENVMIHGNGTQIRDLTYIDDAVIATVKLCDKRFDKEVFNIGTGKSISMLDLARKIIKICNSNSGIVFIPNRRPTDSHDKFSDPTKIKNVIGWKSTTELEEGLRKTFEYYKKKM